MLDDVPDFLRGLAQRVAVELWNVARREPAMTRLVLPTYRDGSHRVSEQEARSIAQRLVADSHYYFSIETRRMVCTSSAARTTPDLARRPTT